VEDKVRDIGSKLWILPHLIEEAKIAPDSILVITFTKAAANEMKERIGSLVGNGKARELWMGTFHSIFSRILRYEADLAGYTPAFTIYDEADSRSLLKAIIKKPVVPDETAKKASA